MGRAFEFRKARKMKRWSAMSKALHVLEKTSSWRLKMEGPIPTLIRVFVQ